MVRLSRLWRTVWRMGHPQVRWFGVADDPTWGNHCPIARRWEDVDALPLNWVECGKFPVSARAGHGDRHRYGLDVVRGGDSRLKVIDFLCTFTRCPSKACMKFGRNSTTEKSPIRRLLSRGNTSPLHNF